MEPLVDVVVLAVPPDGKPLPVPAAAAAATEVPRPFPSETCVRRRLL